MSPKRESIALKNSGGEVGPAGPLAAGEAERAFGPLGGGKGREERVGRLDHLRRYVPFDGGRGCSLKNKSKRRRQRQQNDPFAFVHYSVYSGISVFAPSVYHRPLILQREVYFLNCCTKKSAIILLASMASGSMESYQKAWARASKTTRV